MSKEEKEEEVNDRTEEEDTLEQPLGDGGNLLEEEESKEGFSSLEDEASFDSDTVDIDLEFELLKKERDEFLDALQRLKADFDNFKKRVDKQRIDTIERANEDLIKKLLPALDTLELARTHVREGEAETPSYVEQIGATLMEILSKEGLVQISPLGSTFDPSEAEAVAHEEGEGEQLVTEVLRVGYRWRGRVIRPAMVKVSG